MHGRTRRLAAAARGAGSVLTRPATAMARVRALALVMILLAAAAPAEARRIRRRAQASGGGATMIGGRPPKEIVLATCNIMDLFGHLSEITLDPNCRAGCDGGTCPTQWYPSAHDICSAECGRVRDPTLPVLRFRQSKFLMRVKRRASTLPRVLAVTDRGAHKRRCMSRSGTSAERCSCRPTWAAWRRWAASVRTYVHNYSSQVSPTVPVH